MSTGDKVREGYTFIAPLTWGHDFEVRYGYPFDQDLNRMSGVGRTIAHVLSTPLKHIAIVRLLPEVVEDIPFEEGKATYILREAEQRAAKSDWDIGQKELPRLRLGNVVKTHAMEAHASNNFVALPYLIMKVHEPNNNLFEASAIGSYGTGREALAPAGTISIRSIREFVGDMGVEQVVAAFGNSYLPGVKDIGTKVRGFREAWLAALGAEQGED